MTTTLASFPRRVNRLPSGRRDPSDVGQVFGDVHRSIGERDHGTLAGSLTEVFGGDLSGASQNIQTNLGRQAFLLEAGRASGINDARFQEQMAFLQEQLR